MNDEIKQIDAWALEHGEYRWPDIRDRFFACRKLKQENEQLARRLNELTREGNQDLEASE